MIVDDGHLFRSGGCPAECDAPLVVDSNGMEACSIASESFKPIAGWYGEIAESDCLIHLDQLSQGDPRYGTEPAAPLRDE